MSAAHDRLRRLRDDFEFYAPRMLKIVDKAGSLVPLQLNAAQRILHAALEAQLARTGKIRALVLKGRQQGASTYLEGRLYWRVSMRSGVRGAILTHEQAATDNLFTMSKRYHDNVPSGLRVSTGASNAKELIFDRLDSKISVATAGTKGVGRSSTVHFFHGSEAAFWPHAKSHLSGLGQAIPDLPGTEVVLETTSAGPTGEFHRMWKLAEAGKGDWIAVFIPWFVQAEYRREVPPGWAATDEEIELSRLYGLDDEQLAWRRAKIDTDFGGDAVEFAREYPNTAIEAFAMVNRDTFVDMRNVARARASKGVPMTGPLVVGVDPARMGADRTAIVWRRGRVVYKVKTYEKRTTTQITGLIANLIEADKPAKVFIDIVGLGVGIYDQLVEANYGAVVVGVGGAEAATEPDRYRNKRAECWARMRDWFAAPPVQIPDVDEIAADLICPGYSYDAHNRLLIESKESIAKDPDRRSPDIADAIALTFAEPVRAAKRTAPVMDAWVPIDELTNY